MIIIIIIIFLHASDVIPAERLTMESGSAHVYVVIANRRRPIPRHGSGAVLVIAAAATMAERLRRRAALFERYAAVCCAAS